LFGRPRLQPLPSWKRAADFLQGFDPFKLRREPSSAQMGLVLASGGSDGRLIPRPRP